MHAKRPSRAREVEPVEGHVRREEGVVVVDVGINRVEDTTNERGWRLVGDVHSEVSEIASLMSPVPGGVGPMTVAMLMSNTVLAAEIQHR